MSSFSWSRKFPVKCADRVTFIAWLTTDFDGRCHTSKRPHWLNHTSKRPHWLSNTKPLGPEFQRCWSDGIDMTITNKDVFLTAASYCSPDDNHLGSKSWGIGPGKLSGTPCIQCGLLIKSRKAEWYRTLPWAIQLKTSDYSLLSNIVPPPFWQS
jgi:hypothetical protein